MSLHSSHKYTLKAQAHALKPCVLLGSKGLTEAVMQEIDLALTSHELIKIKLTGVEKDNQPHVVTSISEKLRAECIQIIGKIATFYRQNPKLARKR